MSQHEHHHTSGYWAANVRIITICLIIWALVSHGFAIWLRPMLSGIQFGGADLGFWFGQQGSILCFILLIFFYSWQMNKLEERFGIKED